MPWPSKTIGNLYSRIYSTYQTNAFPLASINNILKSNLQAKVYLHRLKMLGWVYPFEPAGRGHYRLQEQEVCFLISTGELARLLKLRDYAYLGLIGFYMSDARRFEGLNSLILFGSVARGEAKTTSDIDLFGVFDEKKHMDEAWNKTTQLQLHSRLSTELDYLRKFGIHTGISLLPMTEKQFLSHPFVLLDVFADGLTLIDKEGRFQAESSIVKSHLKKIRARRICLSGEEWYWDLNPGYRVGKELSL